MELGSLKGPPWAKPCHVLGLGRGEVSLGWAWRTPGALVETLTMVAVPWLGSRRHWWGRHCSSSLPGDIPTPAILRREPYGPSHKA